MDKPLVKNQHKHHFCVRIIDNRIPKSLEKSLTMKKYDGNGDPNEHVKHIDDRSNYYHTDKATKCKLFELTLIGSNRLWFKALLDGSVKSWTVFCENFSACFTAWKRLPMMIISSMASCRGRMRVCCRA